LVVFLLVLFILFTAIGLTFKLKVLNQDKQSEFGGIFTVKWLFLSHTFLIGEPEEQKLCLEKVSRLGEENIEIKDEKRFETAGRIEPVERERDETEYTVEVKERVEIERQVETREDFEIKPEAESKEKRGILGRIKNKLRRKKKAKPEDVAEEPPESKPFMTNREKLYWAFEAFKALRKTLFRLVSDVLKGIKIKRLESRMTFGLSDPADTGMLCGSIHAVTGLISGRCRHCSFYINPVFIDPMVDLRGKAEIRIRIYSLVLPSLKFMANGKTLSFTYLFVKEILHRKWKSNS
jgi:hypothetical protein